MFLEKYKNLTELLYEGQTLVEELDKNITSLYENEAYFLSLSEAEDEKAKAKEDANKAINKNDDKKNKVETKTNNQNSGETNKPGQQQNQTNAKISGFFKKAKEYLITFLKQIINNLKNVGNELINYIIGQGKTVTPDEIKAAQNTNNTENITVKEAFYVKKVLKTINESLMKYNVIVKDSLDIISSLSTKSTNERLFVGNKEISIIKGTMATIDDINSIRAALSVKKEITVKEAVPIAVENLKMNNSGDYKKLRTTIQASLNNVYSKISGLNTDKLGEKQNKLVEILKKEVKDMYGLDVLLVNIIKYNVALSVRIIKRASVNINGVKGSTGKTKVVGADNKEAYNSKEKKA